MENRVYHLDQGKIFNSSRFEALSALTSDTLAELRRKGGPVAGSGAYPVPCRDDPGRFTQTIDWASKGCSLGLACKARSLDVRLVAPTTAQ